MMAIEKDEYTRFIEKKGRGGCLQNFLVVLIGLILFIVIYDRITINRYKRNPTGAQKEIVEGFAGMEFPPYKVKKTIVEINCFLGDYIDTIKVEFESVPDSSFYDRLEKACEPSVRLEYASGYEDYHFWYKDDDERYNIYYMAHGSDLHYDTIRSIYNSRGVPEDFIVGVDRFYSIILPKNSLEWTIIVGKF
jgi:hypothetical protein